MPAVLLTLLMSLLAMLRGSAGVAGTPGDGLALTEAPASSSGDMGSDANGSDGDDDASIDAPPPYVENPFTSSPPEPVASEPPSVPLDVGVSANVLSARVTTLELPADVDASAVRITGLPEHGNVTVNPDGTLALVLTGTDYTGPLSFSYEVRDASGATTEYRADINVTPGPQAAGWGNGAYHYMLATDENDDVIIETGENHRPVYISGSDAALTREDIAAMEGLSPAAINGSWLAANSEYGGSEGMALAPDIGMELWYTITGSSVEPNSNWLLFERGYTYDDLGRLIQRGTEGESEMHPVHVTSWGEGERPVLDTNVTLFQDTWSNIAFTDVEIADGVLALSAGETEKSGNLLFDDVRFSGGESIFINVDGITIRNSEVVDVFRESPNAAGDTWEPGANRISGIYANGIDGFLIDGSFVDYNSWREGYDPNLSIGSPQPPSMFSHNIYLDGAILDLTFTDTIVMRAASFGAQIRSGAYVEDNVFVDNNGAFNVLGGNVYDSGALGQYTFVSGNLVTSAGYKKGLYVGALGWGIDDQTQLSTFLDNIVAHAADPSNPDEIAAKTGGFDFGFRSEFGTYYNDTIIYNWSHADDVGIGGLDTDVLDQTTIQRFAAALTGNPDATIADLGDYFRALSDSAFDDSVTSDDILRFFQQGFGIYEAPRTETETVVFQPSDLAEGVRWDNRENWSTGDLPGTVDGDSVDLNGNWVYFGGTETVQNLDFGSGGRLIFNHGKLTVAGDTTAGFRGAEAQIDGTGQFWMDGYGDGDRLTVTLDGGRFANTGEVTGAVDLVAADGQAILATSGAEYAVTSGSRLEVASGDAKVGFDGTGGGQALLGFGDGATLAIGAADGTLGAIGEFRSGAFGDASNVNSGIDLGGRLDLDLSKLAGTGTFTLVSADEIVGSFGATNISGLGARNATVTVDYATDTVKLTLTSGSGAVTVTTVGAESDVSAGDEALWAALTANSGTWDDTLPPPEDDEAFSDAA